MMTTAISGGAVWSEKPIFTWYHNQNTFAQLIEGKRSGY